MRLNLRIWIAVFGIGVVILLITALLNREAKWNQEFVAGKITKESVLLELPLGSDYGQLKAYIKRHKIAKYAEQSSWGYTDKIFKYDLVLNMADSPEKKSIEYVVELHGHKDFQAPPGYYHPYLYFCYNKDNSLILLGSHGYP